MLVLFKRLNVKAVLLAIVIGIGALVSGCQSNDIVAEVNGEEISLEEYEQEYSVYKKLYEGQLGEGALSEVGPDGTTLADILKDDIMNKLILEKIVEQEAEKKDIKVNEEELNAAIAEIKESIGGEEKYDEFLIQSGFTEEYFQSNTEKELLFTEYEKNFYEELDLTDEQGEEYFEDHKEDLVVVKASHILFSEEEKGAEILTRLENGEDFGEIAKEESLDSSAVNGGDLGYFPKGKMIQEFDEVAFALEEGEVSGVVKTDVGYHIIKVEDRKDSYEELKDEIMQMIKQNKFEENLLELRENADIKIYEEVLDKIDSEEAVDTDAEETDPASEDETEEPEIDIEEETEATEETETEETETEETESEKDKKNN